MDPLPRRAYLGLDVEQPRTRAGQAGARLVVVAVEAGQAAARAGIRVGDEIIAIDATPVADLGELHRFVARLRPGRDTRIQVWRRAVLVELTVVPEPLPLEKLSAGRVVLDEVGWNGQRLRAIWTLPERAPPYPAVWLLPGASWISEEQPLRSWYPTCRLVDALTRAGFATLRVDRSGLGDSEGPPCTELDLVAELSIWQAAWRHFTEHLWVEPTRRFAYARSLGGMLAPLVLRDESVASVVVWGSCPGPWHECMLEISAQQYTLNGLQGPALDEALQRLAALQHLVYIEGLTPEQAYARRPELQSFLPSDFNRHYVYGRTASFFQQLQRAELAAAWREVNCPVLALRGSCDWLSLEHHQRRLAALAPRGHWRQLPGLDHHMHERPSLREAIVEPWGGEFDPRAVAAIVEFFNQATSDARAPR